MSAADVDPLEASIPERIGVTYATALRHAHEGGRIEIHVGSAVVDHLKSMATHPRHPLLNGLIRPRMFGFPVIENEGYAADHISVHVIHVIH